MKIVLDGKEIPPDELMEKAAQYCLDRVWRLAEGTGLCPICLTELMYEMMCKTQEQGLIHHTGGSMDDGEEDTPEPTHDGTETRQ